MPIILQSTDTHQNIVKKDDSIHEILQISSQRFPSFHSAYDCSFGEEVECEILSGEIVTNYGNKEVFPYMEFTTKGGEVKIWNSANKDTFVFTHPQSDYQISVDNEKLTTHMTGTDVGMDRHLSLTSRWQHLPPGETHIFFSGIDKLRVVLVPRYIG